MADGEIRIDTQIDLKGATKQIDELSDIIIKGLKKIDSETASKMEGIKNSIIGAYKAGADAYKAGEIITGVIQSWQEAQVALALYKMTAEGATISQGVMNGVFTVWETLVALFTGQITLATAATSLWSKATAALNAAWEANPVGVVLVVIAAIIGAIVYLWNTNEGFRNAVIGAWNAILAAGQAVWGWLVKFFTEDIPNAWSGMIAWFESVGDWFAELWGKIKQAFIDGWNNIVTFFTESIPAWWEGVKQSFMDGWNAIVTFFTETIPAWIEQIFNWFNELPYKIGYVIGFLLATIIEGCINIWNYLFTNVPIWISEVVNFFAQLPGSLWTWLSNVITNIINWGSQIYNDMVSAVTNTINAVVGWFATLPSMIWQWLSNTISNVAQFASGLASTAWNAGSNMVSNIISAVSSLPSQMLSIGENIVSGVWNGIVGMGSWLADKVGGFFKGIVDGAKAALGIKSPSRVFRDQVGKYMAQGVGVGFEDESNNLQKDIENNLSDLTAKMQATVQYETSSTSNGMVASKANTSSTQFNDEDIPENSTFIIKNYMDSEEISQYTYKKTDSKFAMAGKRVR